jgi:hypothetical protein
MFSVSVVCAFFCVCVQAESLRRAEHNFGLFDHKYSKLPCMSKIFLRVRRHQIVM